MHPVQKTKHTNHNGSQLYVAELNKYYKPWEFISLDYRQNTGHQTITVVYPGIYAGRYPAPHATAATIRNFPELYIICNAPTTPITPNTPDTTETAPASRPSALSKPNHTNHDSLQSYVTASHIRKRPSTQTSRGPRTIATYHHLLFIYYPLLSQTAKPRQYKL